MVWDDFDPEEQLDAEFDAEPDQPDLCLLEGKVLTDTAKAYLLRIGEYERWVPKS